MDRNIYIEDIEVEWTSNGKNIIDIDFITKVSYEKPTVTIKQGKDTQEATIRERDQDDLELIASDLKPGETYTITIDGIKPKQTKQTGTLTIYLYCIDAIFGKSIYPKFQIIPISFNDFIIILNPFSGNYWWSLERRKRMNWWKLMEVLMLTTSITVCGS